MEQNILTQVPNLEPGGLVQQAQNSAQDDLGLVTLLKESWEILKSRGSVLLVAGAIAFLVQLILGMLQNVLQPDKADPTLAGQLVGIVGGLVTLFLSAGLYDISLKLVRGQQTKTSDLFSRKDALVPLLLSTIVVSIAVGLGLLLLAIPGIYLSFKYFFVAILSVDQVVGPMESLSRAAKLTDGRKMQLLGFVLGIFVFNLLGVLALGIGLLITLPVSALAQVILYDRLLRKKGLQLTTGSTSAPTPMAAPISAVVPASAPQPPQISV